MDVGGEGGDVGARDQGPSPERDASADGGGAPDQGPAPTDPVLACEPLPGWGAATVGQSLRHLLLCTVQAGTVGATVRIEELSTTAPFSAAVAPPQEAGLGGQLGVELVFVPRELGEFEAPLTIRYGDGERTGEAELQLAGAAVRLPNAWDPTPPERGCRADGEAALLDEVLHLAGLERDTFGFYDEDLAHSHYQAMGALDDPFRLSWLPAVRSAPARAGCFEGEVAGGLDHYLAQPHPVAGMIRHLAAWLDRPPDEQPPVDGALVAGGFDDALAALCAAAGGECGEPTGELPEDLRQALTPLLWALAEGVAARRARDAGLGEHDAQWWYRYGGEGFSGVVLGTSGERVDPGDPADLGYMVGLDRARLYRAAAQIAYAIEDTDWAPFAGREGVEYECATPAGVVRVADGSDHVHRYLQPEQLLFVELGGDDEYLFPVAANRSAANPVSVAIDLAGQDTYHYGERATPYDREGILPADRDGRYRGQEGLGTISLSDHFRQGAARNGVAMLFDLGEANDHYQSLRGSQGYAHQGVGVLFDGGGDDTYLAELGAQGAGQYGIGLAVDAGQGQDLRRSFTFSQGFGFVAGAGALVDGGGPDRYVCDHGDPDHGGIQLYHSAQLPQNGNSSFCQGAGFGLRFDREDHYFSGGLGVLRDLGGDDEYEASVFAQGTGYWQGTGLLSDGGGSDTYDAYWYVQGGAAHYAVGILCDGGDGDDVYGGLRPARHVTLGAGHDYSLGALVDEAGDDRYHVVSLSAGASNCNGLGLLVDNAGDDEYLACSDYGSGMGNVSGECLEARPEAVSVGVMIDAGGTDHYDYPDSAHPVPSDGGRWGHRRHDLPSEHGGGLDGEGESGVHVESGG